MSVFLGLMTGSFVYHAFTDQMWPEALHTSLLQGFAIFIYWFLSQWGKP